ncbi:aminoglycoside phosphotransferase family protein [Virgibacillus ndiopensis]|uniref:aminoglycoside phosphotransferase family protein n=1 Tax=Virgibacillus ndiopensis TaxID=2004408 RepID=UPI000C0848B0|nr:aminoglycoside phosphotransferase family protein [Virgibacillus ndiopensis]
MNLQKQFVQSVRLYFKERGEEWLQSLPNLIQYCEEKWSIQMREPFSLSVNYVAPATMLDGKEVVVKICIPENGFLDELEALQLFQKKMVKLIDYDKENGIIILETLSPGYTLAEIADDEEACQIAANVIKELVVPVPIKTRIPTLKAREEELKKIVEKHSNGIGPISGHTLQKALKMFTYMNQTIRQQLLLHGDFHHYNVLASGEGEWKAIDPKGLIGEIEYDLIQYMLNKLPEKRVYEVTERRVEIFTNELNLDKERILLWGYCHTVLATAWTVDGESYNKGFFQMINVFEKLYATIFDTMSN